MPKIKNMTKIEQNEVEENEREIGVQEFCKPLGLEVLHTGTREKIRITTFNINRPGLQLAGYYEHFGHERIQVFGEQEMAYLQSMSEEDRIKACDKLFSYDFPCVVLSTNIEPCKEFMDSARKYDRVVLRSKLRTTMIINELSIFLNRLLAPTQTIHGVLLDLYGVGVLIIGNAGIGKSETALELVQRGHRLVADDAVVVRRVSDRLIGSSPGVIRYFMELRGVGIVDVRQMYGTSAIKLTTSIDMVVKLEKWDEEKEYDRLGTLKETYSLLSVKLPMYTIPVKPGRNLAIILEAAARTYRLRSLGVDTLKELDERMKNHDDYEDWDILFEL